MITRPSVDLRRYWSIKVGPTTQRFIPAPDRVPDLCSGEEEMSASLERLEREYGHPESVDPSDLSIEHVLPQTVENDDAGRSWQAALGTAWIQEHEKWVQYVRKPHAYLHQSRTRQQHLRRETGDVRGDNDPAERILYGSHALEWSRDLNERGIALGRSIASIWPRPDGEPYVPRAADPEEFLEETFEQPGQPRQQQPHTHGNLRVIIHWSVLGVSASDESICEPKAALTQAVLFGRLIAEFGRDMSEKLQRIAVARSYPLSANPAQDFINRNTGDTFSYKPVPGTALSVFTNTATNEKQRDILAHFARDSGSRSVA